MKRIIPIALLLCTLVSLRSQGIYTIKNTPKVHLQDKTRHICDPAGIPSVSACGEIGQMLYVLKQQTDTETAVAVVSSIGNEDCFEFSYQLLNEWGMGKKDKNNGLAILLATDQRCIRFYTGYGLEGDLPDAICKCIQVWDVILYLEGSNWNTGMVAGACAICVRPDDSMTNDSDENSGKSLTRLILAVIGFLAIAIVAGALKTHATSKCPRCGQHKLQRDDSVLVLCRSGVWIENVTYTYRNCGHKVVCQQQPYDGNYRGGDGGGSITFSRSGFDGSGGGSSGGSFGGGMGGGGGVGSRF